MKKSILILMVAVFVFGSCKKDEVEPTPELTVSISSKSVTAETGEFTFEIASNTDWLVSSNEAWCQAGTESGENNKTITISYDENVTYDERIATITITSGVENKTIQISQSGKVMNLVADFTFEQQDLYAEGSDKGYKVVFTQNCTDATSYDWSLYDFYSDPYTATGTGETFEHHFIVPGEYDIDITAKNGNFTEYKSKKIFIEGQTAKVYESNYDDYAVYTDYTFTSLNIYKNETDYNNSENEIASYLAGANFGNANIPYFATNLIEGHTYYYKVNAWANGTFWFNTSNYSFIATKNDLTFVSIYLIEQ